MDQQCPMCGDAVSMRKLPNHWLVCVARFKEPESTFRTELAKRPSRTAERRLFRKYVEENLFPVGRALVVGPHAFDIEKIVGRVVPNCPTWSFGDPPPPPILGSNQYDAIVSPIALNHDPLIEDTVGRFRRLLKTEGLLIAGFSTLVSYDRDIALSKESAVGWLRRYDFRVIDASCLMSVSLGNDRLYPMYYGIVAEKTK